MLVSTWTLTLSIMSTIYEEAFFQKTEHDAPKEMKQQCRTQSCSSLVKWKFLILLIVSSILKFPIWMSVLTNSTIGIGQPRMLISAPVRTLGAIYVAFNIEDNFD